MPFTRGLVPGLFPELGWRPFRPSASILQYFTTPGHTTPTQPLLGSSTVDAHVLLERQLGRVSYQGSIVIAADANLGANDEVIGLLLPFPCYRGLGGTDMLIGSAWFWQKSVGNRNLPLRPTQMDPLPLGGTQSNEDYYAQFFLEHMVASGTGSIAAATTSSTITHGLGTTPNVWDIHVVQTANTTTAIGEIFITNVTSTTFDVNVRTAPGASTFVFSWKATVEPNSGGASFDLLVNQKRPFGQWAAGDVLGWSLDYQARR